MGMKVSAEVEARILELAGLAPVLACHPIAGVSEEEFQCQVTALADQYGWHWHHHAISKRSKPGWLDLTIWREARTGLPGKIIFREIKSEDGVVTADQARTIDSLRAAGQDAGVWRPSMWKQVVEALTDGERG